MGQGSGRGLAGFSLRCIQVANRACIWWEAQLGRDSRASFFRLSTKIMSMWLLRFMAVCFFKTSQEKKISLLTIESYIHLITFTLLCWLEGSPRFHPHLRRECEHQEMGIVRSVCLSDIHDLCAYWDWMEIWYYIWNNCKDKIINILWA